MTFVFFGGNGRTEAVMSIATKLDFAQYPSITVLSQQDLENHYRESHPWRLWLPSPLSLLESYLSEVHTENVMVDEAPMETNLWRETAILNNSYVSGHSILLILKKGEL